GHFTERPNKPLAQITRTLGNKRKRRPKARAHRLQIAAVKMDDHLGVILLTHFLRPAKGMHRQAVVQFGRTVRAKKGNKASFHQPGFGITSEYEKLTERGDIEHPMLVLTYSMWRQSNPGNWTRLRPCSQSNAGRSRCCVGPAS